MRNSKLAYTLVSLNTTPSSPYFLSQLHLYFSVLNISSPIGTGSPSSEEQQTKNDLIVIE